ncbi:MAG: PilZ domain-containing protein [Candidatus Omnitrophica bacterium]|nr:PilZ domain-containing protein [Candidatus Omnitrophota bacterium]
MEKNPLLNRNRRSYPRFKVDSFGFLRNKGATIPILIRDISSRGVGFFSEVSLEPGASVEIDANIPFFNFYLSKRGKVVYCYKEREDFFRSGLDFR